MLRRHDGFHMCTGFCIILMVSCGKYDFQCEISIHTFSLISSTCMLLQCYNVFTHSFTCSHDAEKLHLRISSACEDITSRKIQLMAEDFIMLMELKNFT